MPFSTKIFKNAVLVSLEIRKWYAHRQGDLEEIETKADKTLLSLSKKLLDKSQCEEYSNIVDALNQLYEWVRLRSVPSFFKSGFYLIHRDYLPEVKGRIDLVRKELKDVLVPDFCNVYKQAVADARKRLKDGVQWRAKDYPGVTERPDGSLEVDTRYIANKFDLRYQVLAFDIPDELPPEIREEEERKIKETFARAEGKITETLWTGFQGILNHLIDRLSDGKEGERKRFTKGLFDQFMNFVETFKSRNILNDEALDDLIDQAAEIQRLAGYPEALKNDDELRRATAEKFAEIQEKVSKTIETLPSRQFEFD